MTQISTLVKDKRLARSISVVAGTLGWIGIAFFGTILVTGERGPALALYGLAPALLSLMLIAVGARFWQRLAQAQLGIYLATTLLLAVALVFILIGVATFVHHLRAGHNSRTVYPRALSVSYCLS